MQLMQNGGTIGSLNNTPNTSFEQVDVKGLKDRIKRLEVLFPFYLDSLYDGIQNLVTSYLISENYPGEMVNGSSRMFMNVHDVKTTHPIYLNYFSHEST